MKSFHFFTVFHSLSKKYISLKKITNNNSFGNNFTLFYTIQISMYHFTLKLIIRVIIFSFVAERKIVASKRLINQSRDDPSLINFSLGRESVPTQTSTKPSRTYFKYNTIPMDINTHHASNLPCRYSEEFNGTILITRVMASNYNRIITMYHVAIITESNDLPRSMKLYLLESDNTADLLRRQRRSDDRRKLRRALGLYTSWKAVERGFQPGICTP